MFVFHQLPALLPRAIADVVDVITPFAVIGSAAALLATQEARRAAAVMALVAGIVYVDGHGIHLAANSIAARDPGGDAASIAYFWDERFSHIELLVGWSGLLAAFCLAEADAGGQPLRAARALLALSALLLGFTLFTNAVEGQTWWLLLAIAPAFAAWAASSRRRLTVAIASAYALAAALIGVWALVNGGVPQFSELGQI